MDYWIDHPPVDEMIAGYFQIKPRPKKRTGGYATEEQIRAMAKAMGG